MQPDIRVAAICFETNDLLVEVEDAFLMVDVKGYSDASGATVLPEMASQRAATVEFILYEREWSLPLGSNVSDKALLRPDHRAGSEKRLLMGTMQ